MSKNKKIERMMLKLANHYMLSYKMYKDLNSKSKAQHYLKASFKFANMLISNSIGYSLKP